MELDKPQLQTSSLSHSFGDVLLERASEKAPRIKVGDQYFRVMRIVGGRYEDPISNPRELEKAQRIGEVFFSAHKKISDESPLLKNRKIEYINEEGVHYEGDVVACNEEILIDPEDSINYLKATDNFDWQQPVKAFETDLESLDPNATVQRIPHFLHTYIPRRKPTYTARELKKILLDYTREKLVEAHEIYAIGHRNPERQRQNEKEWIHRGPESPTLAIDTSRDYLKAGYLKASHLWKMMVNTLQPAEYRLIREEEDIEFLDQESLLSHRSDLHTHTPHFQSLDFDLQQDSSLLHPSSQHIKPTLQKEEDFHSFTQSRRSSQSSLFEEDPLLSRKPTLKKKEDELEEIDLFSLKQGTVVHPFSSQKFGQKDSRNPFPRKIEMHQKYMGRSQREFTYLDQPNFIRFGAQYRELEIAAKSATSNDWADAREGKELCGTALQKFEANIVDRLTPKELSIVKRIIEIREGNKSDRGAFERLPMSERYRAVFHDLEQYTGQYAIPLSKSH